MMARSIGHISFLTVKKKGSKAAFLKKQLGTILCIDKQLGKLIDTVPEYTDAYNALNRTRSDLFVASQYLQGCDDIGDFAHDEPGKPTPLDEIICLGKKSIGGGCSR